MGTHRLSFIEIFDGKVMQAHMFPQRNKEKVWIIIHFVTAGSPSIYFGFRHPICYYVSLSVLTTF